MAPSGYSWAKPGPSRAARKVPSFTAPNPAFVTILVGKEESKFVVHRDLMFHYSTFFKTAFEGPFVEHETKTMRLEHVDSRLFGVLIHWLYTKEIKYEDDILSSSMPMQGVSFAPISNSNEKRVKKELLMAMLWMLAKTCNVYELQNEVMGLLYTLVKALTLENITPLICYAYKDGEPTALKRLLIQAVALSPDSAKFLQWVDNATEEVTKDLAKELSKMLGDRADLSIGRVQDFWVEVP